MTNEELTIKFLDNFGWDYDLIVNPGHYANTTDLYLGDLVLAILSFGNIEEVAKRINRSYKAVNTAIQRFLVPHIGKLHGGEETWKFKLEHLLEIKQCSDCGERKEYIEYHKDAHSPRGISPYCKKCRVSHNALIYKKDNTKEAHRRSYEKHKFEIQERNNHYKQERALRIPIWSETEQIIEFYSSCPEGSEVDHRLPLKGEFVSGLHVLKNLQYLSKEENRKKGNRIDLEEYNGRME